MHSGKFRDLCKSFVAILTINLKSLITRICKAKSKFRYKKIQFYFKEKNKLRFY